jgi:hypothetical protein
MMQNWNTPKGPLSRTQSSTQYRKYNILGGNTSIKEKAKAMNKMRRRRRNVRRGKGSPLRACLTDPVFFCPVKRE